MPNYEVQLENAETEETYLVVVDAPSKERAMEIAESRDRDGVSFAKNARLFEEGAKPYASSATEHPYTRRNRAIEAEKRSRLERAAAAGYYPAPGEQRIGPVRGLRGQGRRGTNHTHPAGPRPCPKCGV